MVLIMKTHVRCFRWFITGFFKAPDGESWRPVQMERSNRPSEATLPTGGSSGWQRCWISCAEMHYERELAAGKGLLPLLSPGTRSRHTGSQRDFIQHLLHTEDHRARISPGVIDTSHLACPSHLGHLHPPSALPPGSPVSVPCFSHTQASLSPHSFCFPCSHPLGGGQVCPNSLLPAKPLGHWPSWSWSPLSDLEVTSPL